MLVNKALHCNPRPYCVVYVLQGEVVFKNSVEFQKIQVITT